MKRSIRFGLLILAALLLFALAALPLSAEQNDGADVVSFQTLKESDYRNGGISAVFFVNRNRVSALENAGYRVVYGSVVAFDAQNGAVRDLAIAGSYNEGYAATLPNARAVTVYATGGKSYASNKHIELSRSNFSTTVIMNDLGEKYCNANIFFAGFTVIVSPDGTENIWYDYVENDVTARCGGSVSMHEFANYLVNEYSENSVKAYCYAQNSSLRTVLTACGTTCRTVEAPIAVREKTNEVTLAKSIIASYVRLARTEYVKPEYADYTTSVISQFSTSSSAKNDVPNAANFSWSAVESGNCSYYFTISEKEDFSSETQTYSTRESSYSLYNLKTGTTYYWKVTAYTTDGYTYETPVSVMRTADGVRWIYVDGVRNVRDIGGWTGLKQGRIYRGSELNLVGTHGLQITDAGRDVMEIQLGIKTDLDFRAATENGTDESPIGSSVAWVNYPIGNFTSLYSSQTMHEVIKFFASYENYPIYMHCWGGADRTGTIAFMIEGLCGVSEEDLAIDLELTSFASFGNRYRYDNGNYLYGSLAQRMLSYGGNTLQEKFENCARLTMGLSEAQISNIQAINTQDGAVFRFAEGENGDVFFDSVESDSFSLAFYMRESKSVASLCISGVEIPFTFDAASSTLTVSEEALRANNIVSGIGVITFDDGAFLRFRLSTDLHEEVGNAILRGAYESMFVGGTVTRAGDMITAMGDFRIPSSAVSALSGVGYEKVTVTLSSKNASDKVYIVYYDANGKEISRSEAVTNGEISLSLTQGGDIRFLYGDAAELSFASFAFVKTGSAWIENIANGSYRNFFPVGEVDNSSGEPMLVISSKTAAEAVVGKFTVPKLNVQRAVKAGFTHIRFKVSVTFPTAVKGCCLSVVSGDTRLELTEEDLKSTGNTVTAYISLALTEGNVITFTTQTCRVVNGEVDLSSAQNVNTAQTVISEVSFFSAR